MGTIAWLKEKKGLIVDYHSVIGKSYMKHTKKQDWYKDYIEQQYRLPFPEVSGFLRFNHTLIDSYFLMRIMDEEGLTDDDGDLLSETIITVQVPRTHNFEAMLITGINGKKLRRHYLIACRGRTKEEQEEDKEYTVILNPVILEDIP